VNCTQNTVTRASQGSRLNEHIHNRRWPATPHINACYWLARTPSSIFLTKKNKSKIDSLSSHCMSEEIELNPLITVTLPQVSITSGPPVLKEHWHSQTLPKFAIICLPAKESNLGQTEAFTTPTSSVSMCFHNSNTSIFILFARNTRGFTRQIALPNHDGFLCKPYTKLVFFSDTMSPPLSW